MSNISHHSQQPTYIASVRSGAEREVGIMHYVSPIDFAWHGDIRKRYTDFQVNEISRDGKVLHLQDYVLREEPSEQVNTYRPSYLDSQPKPIQLPLDSQPKPIQLPKPIQVPNPVQDRSHETTPIKDEDMKILEDLVQAEGAKKLQELYSRIVEHKTGSMKARPVVIATVTDRQQRGVIHREIRRIFSSRIETSAEHSGVMIAVPFARPHNRGQNNDRRNVASGNWRTNDQSYQRRVSKRWEGDYLHFTLYKENKDTMDAINHIARMLKIKSTSFGFAGTKDRRAATVQRVSVWHQAPDNLTWLNDRMPNVKVGDFEYKNSPIQLGQHGGNQFVIVVKNVQLGRGQHWSFPHRFQAAKECVTMAVNHMVSNGFINYFGLQRFGTHTIGTQEIGLRILKEDFEGAVDALLNIDTAMAFANPEADGANRDEINRARAIAIWKSTGNAKEALDILPKRYSAETSIIRHLGRDKESRKDYCGALLTITRGLRQMYVHAYQSFVWNFVASRRWATYGDKVIEGDLVVIENGKMTSADDEDEFYQEARPLTAEEAESGEYTIFSVVLPTPGFDVVYPNNEIGEYYVEFMGREKNGRLNPYDMRRRQKEFSLSGAYRKLIARFIDEPTYEVRAYTDDNEQMHQTDVDLIKERKVAQPKESVPQKSVNPDDPATLAWLKFAGNAGAYDNALDQKMQEERRRRRSQDPSPEIEARINDTWVQTALDGTLKRQRISISNVEHTIVEKNPEHPDNKAFSDQDSAETKANETVQRRVSPVPVTITASSTPDSASHQTTKAPIPLHEGEETASHDDGAASKPKGIMGFLAAGLHHQKRVGSDETELLGHTTRDDDASLKPDPRSLGVSAEMGPASAQPSIGKTLSWPMCPVIAAQQATNPPLSAGFAVGSGDQIFCSRSPSTGPTTGIYYPPSPRVTITSPTEPPTNSKIAVVLTFKLNSSNYATMALRELMGVVPSGGVAEPARPSNSY